MKTNPLPEPLVGLILAGGSARRMGRVEKALVRHRGRRLADYALDALRPHCARVYISTSRPGALAELGLEAVTDRYPGSGPLAGIQAGLEAARGSALLVLPCDVPGLEADDLEPLASAPDDGDAVIFRHADGTEPLVARYSPRALPVLDEALREGRLKVFDILEHLDARYLDFAGDPGRFRNLNYTRQIEP